jgi:hypothetical protein
MQQLQQTAAWLCTTRLPDTDVCSIVQCSCGCLFPTNITNQQYTERQQQQQQQQQPVQSDVSRSPLLRLLVPHQHHQALTSSKTSVQVSGTLQPYQAEDQTQD